MSESFEFKEFQFTREELVALLTAHGLSTLVTVSGKKVSRDEIHEMKHFVGAHLDDIVGTAVSLLRNSGTK
jgi:hypothetical protein